MQSSEGRQLAEQEHHRQTEKAKQKNPNTYLQSVPAKKLYFETSAKSGEGVGELFEFIRSTLVVELERQSSSGSERNGRRRGGGKSGTDQPIKVGEDRGSREREKTCCK